MPKIIENIRETILEKGKEMLLEENYSQFNIRNLAKRCNLGLGTFYNYFSGKEELAYYIFKNDWDKTLELIDELKHIKIPFADKLQKIYISMETFVSQYMNIFREMSDSGIKDTHHDHYTEIFSKMVELIDIEKKDGGIVSEIDSGKLSFFVVSNILSCIKHRPMTFEELIQCMRI